VAVRADLVRIAKEKEACSANLEAARLRMQNTSEDVAKAREDEVRLEAEWVRLGGEQEARRREEAARLAHAMPVLRKAIALNQNVTHVTWDFTAPDNCLAGTVTDAAGGTAVTFRFQGDSEFELANRVWGVIG